MLDCQTGALAPLLNQEIYGAWWSDVQNVYVGCRSADSVLLDYRESSEACQRADFGQLGVKSLKEFLPRTRRQRGQDSPL